MKLNGPGRQILEREKFVSVGEMCMAIFLLTPDFEGSTFDSSRLSTERSSFLHPQYPTGEGGGRERERGDRVVGLVWEPTQDAEFCRKLVL